MITDTKATQFNCNLDKLKLTKAILDALVCLFHVCYAFFNMEWSMKQQKQVLKQRSVRVNQLGIALMLATSSGLYAQDRGFYIGGGLGYADYDDSIAAQVQNAYTRPSSIDFIYSNAKLIDSADTSYKAFVGYKFLPCLGAEFAWQDLGTASYGYSLRSNRVVGLATIGQEISLGSEVKVRGPSISLVGEYAFNQQISGQLRLGLLDAELQYVGNGLNQQFNNKVRHSARLVGLSGQYQITDEFALRADWDRFLGVGKRLNLGQNGSGEFDHVDMLSLNLVYSFSL